MHAEGSDDNDEGVKVSVDDDNSDVSQQSDEKLETSEKHTDVSHTLHS